MASKHLYLYQQSNQENMGWFSAPCEGDLPQQKHYCLEMNAQASPNI